jgi:hypothetical protein
MLKQLILWTSSLAFSMPVSAAVNQYKIPAVIAMAGDLEMMPTSNISSAGCNLNMAVLWNDYTRNNLISEVQQLYPNEVQAYDDSPIHASLLVYAISANAIVRALFSDNPTIPYCKFSLSIKNSYENEVTHDIIAYSMSRGDGLTFDVAKWSPQPSDIHSYDYENRWAQDQLIKETAKYPNAFSN